MRENYPTYEICSSIFPRGLGKIEFTIIVKVFLVNKTARILESNVILIQLGLLYWPENSLITMRFYSLFPDIIDKTEKKIINSDQSKKM